MIKVATEKRLGYLDILQGGLERERERESTTAGRESANRAPPSYRPSTYNAVRTRHITFVHADRYRQTQDYHSNVTYHFGVVCNGSIKYKITKVSIRICTFRPPAPQSPGACGEKNVSTVYSKFVPRIS